MSDDTQKPLDDLQEAAERRRAELTQTVDRLGETISDTVSPRAVKREVKEYVQDSSSRLYDTARAKTNEYPLETVAVAGLLSYPLWKFVARTPLPFLLLGAGAALSYSSRSNAGLSERQLTDQVRDTAAGLGDQLSGSAQGLTESLSETARSTTGALEQVRSDAMQTAERFPALVGGLGVALGALIGAALPKTSAESETMGELSQRVRGTAGELVSTNVAAAKQTLEEAYEETSRTVEQNFEQADQSGGVQDQNSASSPTSTSLSD